MKTIKKLAIALFVIASTQFSEAQTKKINVESSFVEWTGRKLTGAHMGYLKFNSGTLLFENGKLKGGTFEVNMASLEVIDLKAGSGKEKLEGHLKSDDFFGVDKHKTASLVFKKITDLGDGMYKIVADLTIKGITNSVTFDLAVAEERVRTQFEVDRTKYNIKYGSGSFFDNLGDKAINDNFELSVGLFF